MNSKNGVFLAVAALCFGFICTGRASEEVAVTTPAPTAVPGAGPASDSVLSPQTRKSIVSSIEESQRMVQAISQKLTRGDTVTTDDVTALMRRFNEQFEATVKPFVVAAGFEWGAQLPADASKQMKSRLTPFDYELFQRALTLQETLGKIVMGTLTHVTQTTKK